MAARELLTLDEATPQIIAPQAGDTVVCPITLNAATGNEIAYDLQYTVNKATSGNDTGLLVNQTDTASPGTSLLADFQVGGVSKLSIDNTGTLKVDGTGLFAEQAVANTDQAGYGQLWVKTATPNELWFTDDAGNDYQISNVGLPSGFTLTYTANDNYGIGTGALDSVTASSGLRNIGFGRDVGTAITTGDDNITIGYQAGESITSSSNNILIGYQAGRLVTWGDNVLIGVSSGKSLGTGSQENVGIGSSALANGSGGRENVAIGSSALSSGGASEYNVAVGKGSASGLSTGDHNVMLGWQCAASAGVTTRAICLGANGQASTDSVAIGYNAGAVMTGIENIVIGAYAGDTISTGTNNIVIGKSADTSGATASDELVINSGGVSTIAGSMGARTDVDYSAKVLTVTGPSAFATASTNLNAGDLILQGGTAATTGAGVGGDLILKGGAKGSTGTEGAINIGTAATSTIGLWGATPVAQQAGTGESTGFTAGAGTAVLDDSTFTGNVGSTAYRINDIVKALKNIGALAP